MKKELRTDHNYYVSDSGKIFHFDKEIGHNPDPVTGYRTVYLPSRKYKSKSGRACKKTYIHRIVAEAFIPNPQGLPEVNHIDGNKTNNNVRNLEWVSYSANIIHAMDNDLNRRRRPIMCVETKEQFASIREAAAALGIGRSALSECLSGRNKTCNKYHWKYIE